MRFLCATVLALITIQTTEDIEQVIDVMIKETPLEERIGQLLMVSLEERAATSNSAIAQVIQKYQISGVVYFSGNIENPEQLSKLSHDLNSYSAKYPLFIAIDQEGGHTNRLDRSNGFPKTYSAQEIGERNDINFTKQCGRDIGETLKKAGININFAPSVDININPNNPIIGAAKRSFSKDPKEVTTHAEAFIDGMHEHRIFATLKHFPGHGSSNDDSHDGAADVTTTYRTDEELYPYKMLKEKTELIMTGHVFNSNIDKENPATLSYNTITKMLREELKYDGVVITDSLTMGAITEYYRYEDSLVLALNAGNDILLVCDFDTDIVKIAIDTLMKAVAQGIVTEDRINESFRRIQKLKLRLK